MFVYIFVHIHSSGIFDVCSSAWTSRVDAQDPEQGDILHVSHPVEVWVNKKKKMAAFVFVHVQPV